MLRVEATLIGTLHCIAVKQGNRRIDVMHRSTDVPNTNVVPGHSWPTNWSLGEVAAGNGAGFIFHEDENYILLQAVYITC